jgi:hypothetical protein
VTDSGSATYFSTPQQTRHTTLGGDLAEDIHPHPFFPYAWIVLRSHPNAVMIGKIDRLARQCFLAMTIAPRELQQPVRKLINEIQR